MMNPEFWIREPDAADPFPELSFWNLTLETFLGAPMETKASFLGHPIHQMMIVLPLGLLATAASFDLIASGTRNAEWLDPTTTFCPPDFSPRQHPRSQVQ
jgi:hypothetical protein